jgi:hypothetical protein
MMFTILLPSLLTLAATLALSAMIATWLRYAAAWDAMDAEMRGGKRAPVRMLNVARTPALVPVPIVRARPPADRSRPGRRVGA